MNVMRFWSDLSLWSKFGLAFVAAVAILFALTFAF